MVLYSTDSELLITNCTFDNNKDGAVIAVFHSKVRILNSYFSGNIVRNGTAIRAYQYNNDTLAIIIIIDTHFCYNEPGLDTHKLNIYTVDFPGVYSYPLLGM